MRLRVELSDSFNNNDYGALASFLLFTTCSKRIGCWRQSAGAFQVFCALLQFSALFVRHPVRQKIMKTGAARQVKIGRWQDVGINSRSIHQTGGMVWHDVSTRHTLATGRLVC